MAVLQGYVITTTLRTGCIDVVEYSLFLLNKDEIKRRKLHYKLVDRVIGSSYV